MSQVSTLKVVYMRHTFIFQGSYNKRALLSKYVWKVIRMQQLKLLIIWLDHDKSSKHFCVDATIVSTYNSG